MSVLRDDNTVIRDCVRALENDESPCTADCVFVCRYDFKQKEDWGEQLGGVSLLRPFVIALNPASSCIGQALMRPRVFGVTIAGGSDAASRFENFSMGQPVFAPGQLPFKLCQQCVLSSTPHQLETSCLHCPCCFAIYNRARWLAGDCLVDSSTAFGARFLPATGQRHLALTFLSDWGRKTGHAFAESSCSVNPPLAVLSENPHDSQPHHSFSRQGTAMQPLGGYCHLCPVQPRREARGE